MVPKSCAWSIHAIEIGSHRVAKNSFVLLGRGKQKHVSGEATSFI